MGNWLPVCRVKKLQGARFIMASCHLGVRSISDVAEEIVAWKSVRAVISRRPELNAEERPEFSPRWAERRETG